MPSPTYCSICWPLQHFFVWPLRPYKKGRKASWLSPHHRSSELMILIWFAPPHLGKIRKSIKSEQSGKGRDTFSHFLESHITSRVCVPEKIDGNLDLNFWSWCSNPGKKVPWVTPFIHHSCRRNFVFVYAYWHKAVNTQKGGRLLSESLYWKLIHRILSRLLASFTHCYLY